jgi:hypothetical protein
MHIAGMVLGCLLLGANAEKQATPPELVAKAMTLPAGGTLSGQPLTMLSALSSSTTDRDRQLKIIHAYWQLAEAAANYHFSRDYAQSLDNLKSRSFGDAALRSATASAEAQIQESASAAVLMQHELAELMHAPAGQPLPLPADPPCVGAYDTKYKELFAQRTPPGAARLNERILPIQRQAIDQRAKAVDFAEDAAREDYQNIQDAVACRRDLFEQQKAFFHLTRAYNCNIADYGLAVVPVGTDVQLLAGVLVGASKQPAADTPTLAPPKKANEPTPAPPKQQWQTRKPGDFQPGGSGGNLASADATTLLYPTLTTAAPVAKARQLTATLHGNQSLPAGFGKPIRLGDCLQRNADGNRRAVIDAYWLVRQRSAQYLVLDQQAKWFSALKDMAFERRQTNPTDMLRLRAAQMAAEAATTEARVALVEAQFALASRIGEISGEAWPLASTVPHVGGYDLRLNVQPRGVADSWPVRRLKETIPNLSQLAMQRAAAVIEADGARADTVDKYRSGGVTVSQAIDSVADQTEQTTAFLSSLTEFNRAIAEYATTVLPPNISPDQLVGSLVAAP